MALKNVAPLFLLSLLTACSTMRVVTQPNDAGAKFSYEIKNYGLLAQSTDNIERVTVDGKPGDFRREELLVRLREGASIEKFLLKYGGTVERQERLGTPVKVESDLSGNVKTTESVPGDLRPFYWISFPVSTVKSIKGFEELASRHGVKGHFEFSNESGAKLFYRYLQINEDKNPDVESVCVNQIIGAQTVTQEYTSAPDTGLNWFTASWPYGTIYGNNIVSQTYGVPNLSYYGTGYGKKISIVDAGFQGSTEASLPAAIIGAGHAYYYINEQTGSSVGFFGQGTVGDPWHGRMVTSLISAPSNDFGGTIGTAPNATVLLENVYNSNTGLIDTGYMVQAFDRSVNWGANVISTSLGASPDYPFNPLYGACQRAYNSKVIIVACTGNNGYHADEWPAYWKPYVMGVAAHDQSGANANWGGGLISNTAPADLWAAGTNIAVAKDPSAYSFEVQGRDGTSLSTPIVAGVVAVAMETGRLSSGTSNTADAVNWFRSKGYYYTAGRALNAIQTVQ